MNPFCPTVAKFRLKCAACEFEPRVVEVVTQLIQSGHPNQYGRPVRNQPEPLLALPQLNFRAAAIRQVHKTDQTGISEAGKVKFNVPVGTVLATNTRLQGVYVLFFDQSA